MLRYIITRTESLLSIALSDVYNTFTNVQAETDENAADTLEEIYEVTWVPDGFELVMDDLSDSMHQMEYRKGEDYIWFRQFILENYSVNYDTEHTEIEQVEICSMDGFWISETQVLVWKNEEYVFEIIVSIDLEQHDAHDVAVSAAESVQKVEDQ